MDMNGFPFQSLLILSVSSAVHRCLGPYGYMTPRLKSLVLWEKPAVSGAVLASALGLVLTCRWVSLLNVVCALFVFGIAGAFVYVNGLLVFNRVTNKANTPRPLERYYSRSAEFLHLDSDNVHRRVDYVTDSLNAILTELAKVVLIENNKRSLKFIGIFYAIWTLRSWFSTTTLLSMIIISLFAAPRIYLDNQSLIDANVAKTNNLVQQHVGKGRQVAQEQWSSVYTKAEQFAKDKGLMKKSDKKLE
ncbi:Reticulon-domain-containing protein [Gamsiella multidivaricata]|uniref:Reticulon-domain-containing protein n=1 Tax=Gamsiella multidivaricata TaxID=101098 RepID=UPI00221F726A|nr:Reticulon-domain-containing protein [Gamsiella multidivaricata]KAI7816704.1 Reticulon-domain-containing protein [Gamsiella multidivaricata]